MRLTLRYRAPTEIDHELIWLSLSLGSLALAAGWFAHRSVHSGGKAFSPTPRSYFTALELDLPALAPARFVLDVRFKPSISDLLSVRQCPRGKSPSRRFPIRTRTSRFTS